MSQHVQADHKIALLIDADNAPAAKIDSILSELAKYGVANVRRAYGNWKSPTLKSWEEALHEYAIRPIQQFDYSKGKNSTDIALVIDAMDLLYTQKLDAFCIVSSDSDFTPLIMRILTNGLRVYGFGEKKTPVSFVNACSKFTFLEALGNIDIEAEPKLSTIEPPVFGQALSTGLSDNAPSNGSITSKAVINIKSDAKLMHLLRSAVTATAGENGFSLLSAVGTHISNQTSFDSRNYGFSKLSDLFDACDCFEVRRPSHGTVAVRLSAKTDKSKIVPPTAAIPVTSVAASLNGKNGQETQTIAEKYTQLLKKKQWVTVSKFTLLNFYRVMKKPVFYDKDELINLSLENRPSSSKDFAKNAFDIFWKTHLFDCETNTEGKKCFRLQDFPDVAQRIDMALLSRLVAACKEHEVGLDMPAIMPMLYGDYEEAQLKIILEQLQSNANEAKKPSLAATET